MPSLALKASINYPFVGPSGPSYDPDASAWFSAVEATGANFGASPESISSNKTAFNTAFLSLKSNGIWSSIRQACFLVGPSTLAGALVNIKLTGNPVNYNFTSGNYNKLTGLIGSTGGGENTTRYLDTLLNDTTDINGLDFHMLAQTTMPYGSIGSQKEYIFGSNNDGAQTGAEINLFYKANGFEISPISYESVSYGSGDSSVTFSRNESGVTFRGAIGWGTYDIEYADYFSGRNFFLFKTDPEMSSNFQMYRGEISFYSIGTSTNVQLFIEIVDTLKNSLVN
jgi:hypothetical protein